MNDKRGVWSCYDPRFMAIVAVATIVIIGGALLARTVPKGSPERIALALVMGAASATVIVAMFRAMRRLDEFQQRVQLEALAFSFAGTGIVTTAYGFLIGAGLPDIEWGALVWPLMCALWAIGLVISRRRYR